MAQNLKQMTNYLIITFCILSWRTAEGIHCRTPVVERGFFHPELQTYGHQDKVNYRCDSGYKPITEGWWSTITCERGTWSQVPQCIDKDACIPPEIRDGTVIRPKTFYWNEDNVEFSCNIGYLTQNSQSKCKNGDWKPLPTCRRDPNSCSAPPQVIYAVINQEFREIFGENESVVYDCIDSYTINGTSRSTCSKGAWTQHPTCVPISSQTVTPSPTEKENSRDRGGNTDLGSQGVGGQKCPDPPGIENGDFTKEGENKAIYQCGSFYKLVNNPTITCSNGQWGRPPRCEPNFCKMEGKIEYLKKVDAALFFKDGERKRVDCESSWYSAWATCKDGIITFERCEWRHGW